MGPRRRVQLAVWRAWDLIGEQQLGHVSSAGRGYAVEASSGPLPGAGGLLPEQEVQGTGGVWPGEGRG